MITPSSRSKRPPLQPLKQVTTPSSGLVRQFLTQQKMQTSRQRSQRSAQDQKSKSPVASIRPSVLKNPEVKNKGYYLAKKSLRKLTVPREFKLTGSTAPLPRPIAKIIVPKPASEADRLYAMLESKGILDLDDSTPMLNAVLTKNYDEAMRCDASSDP